MGRVGSNQVEYSRMGICRRSFGSFGSRRVDNSWVVNNSCVRRQVGKGRRDVLRCEADVLGCEADDWGRWHVRNRTSGFSRT
jgi:hypothetical protein